MRIPSTKTDIYIYFVAVDSVDLKTRKTGLTSFTVYRSRNGGAATSFTSPTITELSASNMPGVYALLVSQDTAIASTSDTEEYALHITQASMAPVTRVLELFRRDTTSGRTQLVDANGRVDVSAILGVAQTGRDIGASVLLSAGVGTGQLDFTAGVVKGNTTQILGTAVATPATAGLMDVNVRNAGAVAWNSGAITAATFASGAITAAKFAANALDAVWSTVVRTLTANPGLDAAATRAAIGMASANMDTQLTALSTNDTTINNNVTATFNRIGAPVSSSISADIASIPTLNGAYLLDTPDGIETGVTLRRGLRGMLSALLGKASGVGTTNPIFRDTNDTKNRINAVVDQSGNRYSVMLDLE